MSELHEILIDNLVGDYKFQDPENMREALDDIVRAAVALALDNADKSAQARITKLEGEIAEANEAKRWSRDWYAVRWERLRDLLKDSEYWEQANCVMANGTASATEPPTYAQILNIKEHRITELESFLNSLLSPEEFGWAVSKEVRDNARELLGMKRVETGTKEPQS